MQFNPRTILRYCDLLNTYAWGVVILWTIVSAFAGFVLGKAYGVLVVLQLRATPLPREDLQFVGNMSGIVGAVLIGAMGYFLGEIAAILWRGTSYALVTLIEIERNTRASANGQRRDRD